MELLSAMDGATPIAANWLRSAAEIVAGKIPDGGSPALGPLEAFLADRSHAPKARRFAFELIRGIDAAKAEALVPGMLDDPSPELRRDAVARLMGEGASLAEGGKKEAAVAIYRKALAAAVEPSQVTPISEALKELGVDVDLPKHFGFLMRWQVVGPFDNTGRAGLRKGVRAGERRRSRRGVGTGANPGRSNGGRWPAPTTLARSTSTSPSGC